jgi:RNA polymerase sigma-70 factor (ECF subfamily)
LSQHTERLRRAVMCRLDARIHRRIDPSDVVQEVFLEACEHRRDFEAQSELPLFSWLRGIAANKLLEVHRRHLGTQMRDARREQYFDRAPPAYGTSLTTADELVGYGTQASDAAIRGEVQAQVREALHQMNALDREVLALKHFEQLTSGEAARVLRIQERAAAKRYLRALVRLKDVLGGMPGGLAGLSP